MTRAQDPAPGGGEAGGRTEPERVLAPLGRRTLTVRERVQLGAYVVLKAPDPGGPAPAAGQFYMLAAARAWGGGLDGRPFLPRAFSVLRHREGELHFMLEAVGPGTERLAELQAGDQLHVLGPLGRGFRPPGARAPLLVGGGVGAAPLGILQDQIRAGRLHARRPARVLLGFRDALHAAGATLLDGARVSTDDGSAGHRGLVTELLAEELAAEPQSMVFACGPPAMLEAVRRLCAELDVPCQLALETGMACGFGACFGCAVPTRQGLIRLCLEGPVLDGGQLAEVVVH
jgi:dihydroorotate dehydrogenase electron transfer subunit